MDKKSGSSGYLMLIFFVVGMIFLFLNSNVRTPPNEITFTEFVHLIESSRSVVKITIQQGHIVGTKENGETFQTYGPVSESLQEKLISKGITVTFQPPEQPSIWGDLFLTLIPVGLIILVLIWMMRGMGGKSGGITSFGKSQTKIVEASTYTFKDVAGVDEAKEELAEVVDFLKNPESFTKLGGRIPKGILMMGSAGTGKTLLAKAIAGEGGVPFLTISGSSFVEMYVGVGASRVRDLFDQAKKAAPCIVFIDEIDAVGRHRGAGLGGGNDEREQTLNQLLVEMDGFEENRGIIVIAATNRPDILDPALTRPGRFDRQVHVSVPDVKGREAILEIHTQGVPLSLDVDLSVIAKGTPGFSGADLENLVNEAALLAARTKSEEISNEHLDLAKDKVTMGPARTSMVMSEKDKESTAYHEVGHALVGYFTEDADPVHKVTVVPRGRALGVTMLLPEEDKLSFSKKQALAMIDYAMGGRAAEELIYEEFTTGASNDIEKATNIARKMVCSWGMSELGPLNFNRSGDGDPFVGREYGRQVVHSEELSKQIDAAIMEIINESYKRVLRLLNKHKDLLHKIAKELIEKETLLGSDLKRIIEEEHNAVPS